METISGLKVPVAGTYDPFYKRYIDLVAGKNLREVSRRQEEEMVSIFQPINTETGKLSYQAGKWSLNQVLGHIVDTEKIMHFRALCISRGESAGFPGFDQNKYVEKAIFDEIPARELLSSFLLNRQLFWQFIPTIPRGQWNEVGEVSGHSMSLHALIHIIFGHLEHHLILIRKHYLPLLG
ncbi:DinB superfamily protein [Cyclobacterium lianum]|uniref:DinB superfamily protein n=1 Tax=Cyclobacterium lianum TaxID=388280 RepID=A0A1M7P7R5_9BACT|nr:DinB family protein [Cyclobacterium lianum]SHN12227.1 DinB superfamily protein [Cyclobacterium lianum]